MQTGDLIFLVQEKAHPIFKRVGDTLILNKTISLQDALCGFEFAVPYLDGSDIV